MVYRAKITKIQSWVDEHYNLNAYNRVRDAKDVYIEVSDECEASLLESINKKMEQLIYLKVQWHDMFDKKTF